MLWLPSTQTRYLTDALSYGSLEVSHGPPWAETKVSPGMDSQESPFPGSFWLLQATHGHGRGAPFLHLAILKVSNVASL